VNDAVTKRHILMVRDNQAQTTPTHTPLRLFRQSSFRSKSRYTLPPPTKPVDKIGEFRTIVNLYDGGKRDESTEILSVYTDNPMSALSAQLHGAARSSHIQSAPVNSASAVPDKGLQ